MEGVLPPDGKNLVGINFSLNFNWIFLFKGFQIYFQNAGHTRNGNTQKAKVVDACIDRNFAQTRKAGMDPIKIEAIIRFFFRKRGL